MAAPSRRYRNRPKCFKTMSLLPLVAVLLGLAAAVPAGNDVISAAAKKAKDLQQQQQQQQRHQLPDIEDDGVARTDKDFDFAAYVNGELKAGFFKSPSQITFAS
ncbi:hypothetical protein M5D96_014234 [Drosophila gunungcola]|uniref:Uncharacterized protein n=1 Tax=Drosophila gunungcola TaxID=103775 RepID=A0A9P9Y9S0_9MUSC|nr:hypothetical protein M5D96_014234 [Drosophila gunungcola]